MTGPYDKGKGVRRPDKLEPDQIDRARAVVNKRAQDKKDRDELLDELGLKEQESDDD